MHPFLWSSQARHDLAATHRNPVPLHELFLLHHDFAERLAALPDRTPVQIDFT